MTAPLRCDPELAKYATDLQKRYLDAVNEYGSARKAAAVLKVNHAGIARAIAAVRKKAALAGYAPEADMTHPAPSPFVTKGVSTLYDEAGKLRLQWVKTKLDDSRAEEAIREWVEWLVKDAKGLAPAVKAPKHTDDQLMSVYPMGDPHFGMYAWAAESGDDFDLEIAERLTRAAIDRLVESSPPAHTALVLELGDFFHADNNKNVTPGSGAPLDVDTRWARVMQVGLRAMIYVVQRAAEKHQVVKVKIKRGNHDPHSSFALALALDAYFHGNERVEVDLSPAVHWYYRFGKVLIGSTHGDTTKMKDLPGVMAADRPADWGQTGFRYWYCGHVHHIERKEFPGVVVEYFRTLAARDAWHTGQGYRAGRDMSLIVHHKDFGEIERHTCNVARLE